MEGIPATCCKKDSLHSVAKKMLRDNTAFIPIVDKEKRFLGLISDRDVTLTLGQNEHRPMSELTVRDALTNGAHTVTPDENINTVLRIMRKNRLKCLPVVDNMKRLRGIVSLNRVVQGINERSEEIKFSENNN